MPACRRHAVVPIELACSNFGLCVQDELGAPSEPRPRKFGGRKQVIAPVTGERRTSKRLCTETSTKGDAALALSLAMEEGMLLVGAGELVGGLWLAAKSSPWACGCDCRCYVDCCLPDALARKAEKLMELRPDEVLTPCLQYWEEKGAVPDIVTDGHYTGWVCPAVRASLGIAASADEVLLCTICLMVWSCSGYRARGRRALCGLRCANLGTVTGLEIQWWW